jgi:hypothetical protein
MKIANKLAWMTPYIYVGIECLKSNKPLLRVGTWSHTNIMKGLGAHASIHIRPKGFNIYLHTLHKDADDEEARPYTRIEMLTYLAHELAHIDHWEHTTAHKKLELKILNVFMTMLKQNGYISEEKEMEE